MPGESDSSQRPGAARPGASASGRQPGEPDLHFARCGASARVDAEARHEDRHAVAADDRTVAQRWCDTLRLELELQAARRTACAGLKAIARRATLWIRSGEPIDVPPYL